MKKVLLIFVLLLTVSIGKKSNAYTGNGFVWNKTEINIPINTSFESYLSEFEVDFYYNGNLTNEEVKIELDSFYYGSQTISTDEVCDKYVSLYAYVAGYTNYDRKSVLVHVYDDICPTIKCIKELNLDVTESFSPEDYFSITDNDEIDSSTVVYDYDERELLVIGTHQITVSASDISANHTSRTFTYYVYDSKSPILTVASNIEVEYGDLDFDIREYVEAYDDYDGDLTSSVTCEGLDVYSLGEQEITIYVVDAEGNETSTKKKVTVIDFEAPTLELSTYEDNINITEVSEISYTSYITKIKDNVDDLDISDVIIDYSDYSNAVGQFEVLYTLFDSTGNYVKRTLKINVRYSEAPVIEASDLTFTVGESFDLRDYIRVTSKYDSNVSDNYIIDEKLLNREEVGTYEVIIEAMDYAGNESIKSIYVTIVNDDSSSINDSFNSIYNLIYEYKMVIIVVILLVSCVSIIKIKKNKKKLGI